jgi:SAM-dependent methyltransferase
MKINLGCGQRIKTGWVNCDIHPLPGVDVVMNVDEYPWPWENDSVEHILASHLFEHVSKPVEFVLESWRILKPGGVLKIICPHWTSENAFTDPTHVRFVTDRTFDYWCEGEDLNGPLGAQFLGDTYRFHKIRVRRPGAVNGRGGDIHFELRKLA